MDGNLRSKIMGSVRRFNTKPEIILRKALFKHGLRFRLHRSDLPGTPDIILPRYRLAIFVHGCFWHRHEGCKKSTIPKTNQQFWIQKFEKNIERDQRNITQLVNAEWDVMVVWQCEIESNLETVVKRVLRKCLHKNNV